MKILLISIFYSQIIWGPDISLTPGNDSMGIYSLKAIAWEDTIHLVFEGTYAPNQYDIFYMRSIDKGETWEGPFNLTINDPEYAIAPSIAVWHEKVHVVYWGYDSTMYAMYTRSLDGGDTWEPPRILTQPASSPIIVNIKDTLFVFGGSAQIPFFVIKSFDGGTTWGFPIQIDTLWGGRRAGIVAPYIHTTGYFSSGEVSYYRSPDLGNTWEGPFVISPVDNWSSEFPSLAVSDSNVYITWDESLNSPYPWTGDIYLRKSHDNGNSFGSYQDLTNFYRATYSDVYAKDSIVVVVWTDERDNPGQSEFELYWRASYDYGNNWTEEERLTYASGNSESPCLTGWGNEIYLFWVEYEYSAGLVELYFKKGILVNIEEKQYEKTKKEEIKFLSSNILFLPQKIKFFIKNGEKYSLNLFNLNGQKLKSLKEGIGKGEEEIILDKISSGSYFLILKTKSKILKRKILILEGGKR